MSSLATLSRPYAKAAFELAHQARALAEWDDMLSLASALVSDEAMARLLDNPDVGRAQVVAIMNDAAGEAFNERFRGFLDVLSSNDRLSLLPEIRNLFQGLRAKAENRLRVKVVSAVPLDEDQAGRLKAALASRFECEVELDNEIDAEVIGGAVVYAGDQVIDGSLRGRLNRLSNSLAN